MGIQASTRLSHVVPWMPTAQPAVRSALLRLVDDFEHQGIDLYPQRDFDAYDAVMRANIDRRGYRNPMFDTAGSPDAFWIAGIDRNGGVATTQAGRLFRWKGSNFKTECEALRMHYPADSRAVRGLAETIEVTCPSAPQITGNVLFSGGMWRRRDIGSDRFAPRLARVTRYFAYLLWPLDFSLSNSSTKLAEKGVEYGNEATEPGIRLALNYIGHGTAMLNWSSCAYIEADARRVAEHGLPIAEEASSVLVTG